MAEFTFQVHPDTEQGEKNDRRVIATVDVIVDNPRYKPAYDEEVETEVPVMLENGEFDRDENGDPKTETIKQTVHHRAFSSEKKHFIQQVFIPADEGKREKFLQEYADNYEKDYADLINE